MLRQLSTLWDAAYEMFADSGFSMAGAVAFSFVLSLFPFCIFLGAFAGYFGGDGLARAAVEHLFQVVPAPVAEVLAPEVEAVMGQSRFGLLTIGAFIALFFATSAIESLRSALNVAYRVREEKNYLVCVLQSAGFVLLSALGMLAFAWGIVVGPDFARRIKPDWLLWLADQSWAAFVARYLIVFTVIGAQLLTYHLWLAAGRRRIAEVLPGIALTIVLWIATARLFASWLSINDYSRFYAGLTQLMSALVFFQVTAMIVILGAELNRGLADRRDKARRGDAALGGTAGNAMPPSQASYNRE